MNVNSIRPKSFNFLDRIHQLFDFTGPIAKEIKKLAHSPNFHWDASRQNLVLQALEASHYRECARPLKKLCQRLQPSDLHCLLKEAAKTAPHYVTAKDPALRFKRLTQLLTLEQIEKAVRTEYPHFESAVASAKEMLSYAKYYNDLSHPPALKPALHRLLSNVIWSIESALDTMLRIFGFYHFQRDIENEMDAQYRLHALTAIFSYLSALVTLAIALSGSVATGTAIVGVGVVIGLALLAIYQAWLKPTPRSIKGFVNLTLEVPKNDSGSIDRQRYLDAIAATLLASHQKPKVHPLLIGRSGVGKTELMKAFARAVAEGRYPALKGKQVFYINTADLVQIGTKVGMLERPVTLELIRERLKDRAEDVVLIFDEIHLACKGNIQSNLGERLKTLLDGEFPYVIGATTYDEFELYVQPNDALTRRFKPISIDDVPKDQAMVILNKTLLNDPNVQACQDAIEAIYDLAQKHFPERPQPYMSCRILAQVLAKVHGNHRSSIQVELEELKAALEKNLTLSILNGGAKFLPGTREKSAIEEQNRSIRMKIAKLQELQECENRQNRKLQLLTAELRKSKEQMFNLSIEMEKRVDSKLLKKFMETAYYLHLAWSDTVAGSSNGHCRKIDKALVEEVVAQEIKLRDDRLKQEALSKKGTRLEKKDPDELLD